MRPKAESQPPRPTPELGLALIFSLACAVLALAFFSWLSREVLQGESLHFDLDTRLWIHTFAGPQLTLAMKAISDLGSPVFLSGLFAVLMLVFLRAPWRGAAIWLATSMGGALILDVALKHLFHRPRPPGYFIPDPGSYSFPSGHALGSFCFYMVVAGLLTARLRNLTARILIWTVAGVLVAMIGLSRIYLGVHWPTDVIAGYLAAAVWVSALVALDRRPRAASSRHL
jgi:undecaprenyl-diphosphatase